MIKNIFKKIVLPITALSIILAFSQKIDTNAASNFYITDYYINGVLHEDNTVTVDEYIDVHFTAPSHGIYRNLNGNFHSVRDIEDADGNVESEDFFYEMTYKHIDVEADKFSKENNEGDVCIKIGDENKLIDGDHSYHISYTCVMPDNRDPNSDFIFYSVLGNQWETNIENFSFDFDLDKPLSEDEIANLTIYSGETGLQSNSLNVDYGVDETGISGTACDIPAYNAITIYGDLHKGYFVGAKTSGNKYITWFLFFVQIGLSILVIVLSLTKKQKPLVKTIEFHPPKGLTSADVGTIIDESADDIDLVSLIPWLANEGYITIKEISKKEIYLTKVKELPADSPKYLHTFLSGVFTCDRKTVSSKDLGEAFYVAYKKAATELKDSYTGSRTLSEGAGTAYFMVVLIALAMGLQITFADRISFSHGYTGLAFTAIFAFLLGFFKISKAKKNIFSKAGKKILSVIRDIALILLLFLDLCVVFSEYTANSSYLNSIFFIGYACCTVGIMFSSKLVRETDFKVDMLGHLLGLREFIETAEIEQLKMLSEENPEYYYSIIPYAMVFGLESKWSKKFETIMVPQPSWYTSHDAGVMFSAMYFNNCMKSSIVGPVQRSIAAEAAKAAASSASSSGGFSGGGGGGGGGGSW